MCSSLLEQRGGIGEDLVSMVTISCSLLLSRRLCGLKAGAGLIEGVHGLRGGGGWVNSTIYLLHL